MYPYIDYVEKLQDINYGTMEDLMSAKLLLLTPAQQVEWAVRVVGKFAGVNKEALEALEVAGFASGYVACDKRWPQEYWKRKARSYSQEGINYAVPEVKIARYAALAAGYLDYNDRWPQHDLLLKTLRRIMFVVKDLYFRQLQELMKDVAETSNIKWTALGGRQCQYCGQYFGGYKNRAHACQALCATKRSRQRGANCQ
jgi:hypothetical protein